MNDLMFSIGAVFPLLVMMAAGYAARCLRWIDSSTVRKMNHCVFHFFLPCLLCLNIMEAERRTPIDSMPLLFALVVCVGVFLLTMILVPRFCKQRNACGVLIQGIARSNYAVFGIPLVTSMYPGADTSIAVMLVLVVVPVFNVMATVVLMIYGEEKGEKGNVLRIVKGVLLNPLIIGTVLGFVLWKLQVVLPAILAEPFQKIGAMTTPLALFLLGASLHFGQAKQNVGRLAVGVLGRLVLVPCLGLGLAIAMGMRNVVLASMIAVFASPTAVSSYPMAQQMGGDDNLAAGQVAFSTVFSTITTFLWILVLRSTGFLG